MLLSLQVCYYVDSYIHSCRTRIHVLLLFKPTVWRQGDRRTCACLKVWVDTQTHTYTHTHTHKQTEKKIIPTPTPQIVCALLEVCISSIWQFHTGVQYLFPFPLHQKHQPISKHSFVWCWLCVITLRIPFSHKVTVYSGGKSYHMYQTTQFLYTGKEISLIKLSEFLYIWRNMLLLYRMYHVRRNTKIRHVQIVKQAYKVLLSLSNRHSQP
jgi:hypothetical protein